ncbi:eukaryotic translation initiation factor 1A-like [Zingiber officinale]|uniref:eukaryotic translation initiation factor 1A-like n=1 Tax=Zingiber officinale TaxID=94328 RepID=UPI001C4AC1D8|nr:eukaryotic translation initiation factor 1A-like [Zingiber officinale]
MSKVDVAYLLLQMHPLQGLGSLNRLQHLKIEEDVEGGRRAITALIGWYKTLPHVQITCTPTPKRTLASSNFSVVSLDGSKRLCHIRDKMHKKVWISVGDIILVGLRDYQDDKADIIFKYMSDEARLLKAYGELPENIRLNEGIGGLDEEDEGGADDYIKFEDEDIDKI